MGELLREIERLRAKVAEQSARIEELNDTLEEKEIQIREKDHQLAAKDNQIIQYQSQVQTLNTQLSEWSNAPFNVTLTNTAAFMVLGGYRAFTYGSTGNYCLAMSVEWTSQHAVLLFKMQQGAENQYYLEVPTVRVTYLVESNATLRTRSEKTTIFCGNPSEESTTMWLGVGEEYEIIQPQGLKQYPIAFTDPAAAGILSVSVDVTEQSYFAWQDQKQTAQ